MHVFVTGTRGVPDIPGGVEKHCEKLYPLIVDSGILVTIATRRPYVTRFFKTWRHIELEHLFTPRIKSFEAIVHTFLAVLTAWRKGADIVHIHTVGPGLVVPFARILGLKVVFTNHGPDYDRQKWGCIARAMLRLGEYMGGRFADEVIVISATIGDIIRKRCGRQPVLIPNGVEIPEKSAANDYLEKIGVRPGGYILAVSRFVPEKGLDLLIEAFKGAATDLKLVIAGDADHVTRYSQSLKKEMAQDRVIVGTGYITGDALNQVYSHARLFVLPSYHEGLPIALLEAMSYGLPVLVSDIPANKEVDLPAERYFRRGDVVDLKKKMKALLQKGLSAEEQKTIRGEIEKKYNWDKIAQQTIEVYRKTQN